MQFIHNIWVISLQIVPHIWRITVISQQPLFYSPFILIYAYKKARAKAHVRYQGPRFPPVSKYSISIFHALYVTAYLSSMLHM